MKKAFHIHLRAGERIFVNGAVMRADRKVSLEFLNDVDFLLEAHVMQADATTTPLRQLYFIVQTILMDPFNAAPVQQLFREPCGADGGAGNEVASGQPRAIAGTGGERKHVRGAETPARAFCTRGRNSRTYLPAVAIARKALEGGCIMQVNSTTSSAATGSAAGASGTAAKSATVDYDSFLKIFSSQR